MPRKRAAAVHLKSRAEIEAIRRCGAIIAALFAEIAPRIVPGVTTAALDGFVDAFIRSHKGAVPAFKGLYGFPGSACISINEEVVHGIPSRRKLRDGDIVSVDVGVKQRGWCADSAFTFPVGDVGDRARDIMTVTREALGSAVAAAYPGNHVGDIGAAVVETVRGTGHAIIRDLVGHGVGREIHEEPQVPNIGQRGFGMPLREGMVLAIEPMLARGTERIVTLDDGWTVITADRALSAHFEHTVAITAEGPAVLTGGGVWDEGALEPVIGEDPERTGSVSSGAATARYP